MTEQEFKDRVKERWGSWERRRSHSRVWTGLLLLAIGALLLIRTANPSLFPAWFFTWPVLLIAIGFFSGIRHGFRGGFWAVLIIIGGIFLADKMDPTMHMERYTWPIILIGFGLMFILRPRHRAWRKWRGHYYHAGWRDADTDDNKVTDASSATDEKTAKDKSDFVDVTAVFGGVKKNVLSKNFQGGDVTSFMGGSEIDLSQADFTGKVTIDVTNVFGGTKLVVPSSWDVQNDISAVFGGVDDKRNIGGTPVDHSKVLILDGTCIFGGIEIRSY